jgi:thymidine kinase
VGVMWSDKTFLFTAYTGSAASLFGGVTISKAAFINQNSALSLDDKNEWQDVRILIIDEISFMSDSVLKRLDKNSNKLETQLVFLEDSQSYFQEIFVNLNLSVAMTVSFYFQVCQVDSGTTASM